MTRWKLHRNFVPRQTIVVPYGWKPPFSRTSHTGPGTQADTPLWTKTEKHCCGSCYVDCHTNLDDSTLHTHLACQTLSDVREYMGLAQYAHTHEMSIHATSYIFGKFRRRILKLTKHGKALCRLLTIVLLRFPPKDAHMRAPRTENREKKPHLHGHCTNVHHRKLSSSGTPNLTVGHTSQFPNGAVVRYQQKSGIFPPIYVAIFQIYPNISSLSGW